MCTIIITLTLQVHIFGAALGGYLAQKFAEATFRSPRVASLILCNTFSDTSGFSKVSRRINERYKFRERNLELLQVRIVKVTF